MAFLPPSADQVRSLSDLITLIQAASKPELKIAVDQMYEAANRAEKAQTNAANTLAAVQELNINNAKNAADLARKVEDARIAADKFNADLKALNETGAAQAAAADQLDKDRAAFEKQKKVDARELSDRTAAVVDRENKVTAVEADLVERESDYNRRMGDLRALAGVK